MSYVMRHGQRIEVATLHANDDVGGKRKPKRVEPFLYVRLCDLLLGAKVLKGSKELLVWAFVLRAWRMKPGEPVTVSNVAVTRWGADRRTKYRALAKLEAAGLITILERKARTGPRVMVLL